MKKSVIAIIAVVAITANTVLGTVIFAKLSNKESAKDKSVSNNINSESSNQKVDGSTKSGQEVTLAAEGLKLTVPEGLDFTNQVDEIDTVEFNTDVTVKSDWFRLTSGKLKLSIITHAVERGGTLPCTDDGLDCKIISSIDLVIFKQAKRMNLWEGNDYSDGLFHLVAVSSPDKPSEMALGSYIFESGTGKAYTNVVEISTVDDSADITIDDFKSDDMKKIISILESMRY
ncbi:MAG: hypothetical protein WAS94_00800 [Candidatus Saccharimonadales bacterium]